MVPAMVMLLGMSPAAAKGTSVAVIVPTAFIGTIRNRSNRNADLRTGDHRRSVRCGHRGDRRVDLRPSQRPDLQRARSPDCSSRWRSRSSRRSVTVQPIEPSLARSRSERMHVAVVVAHPSDDSYCRASGEPARSPACTRPVTTVEVLDLYASASAPRCRRPNAPPTTATIRSSIRSSRTTPTSSAGRCSSCSSTRPGGAGCRRSSRAGSNG